MHKVQGTSNFLRSFVVAIPSPGTYFSWYDNRSFFTLLELSVQLSPCLLALAEHSVHENTSYYSLFYLVVFFFSSQLLLLDILNYILLAHYLSPSLDCENFHFSAPYICYLYLFGGTCQVVSDRESAWQCRRGGFNPWVEKITWRRKWHSIPVFLPGKSHGQRSLAGYIQSRGFSKVPDPT